MPAQPPDSVWDKLKRAVNPVDQANFPDGPHQLQIGGTVNILGGGSGGTAQADDSAFVPTSSSLTPAGAYVGGRQVASGHIGAPAMSASAILQVHVVAGGAGGGIANLNIRGTANADVYVGVASGPAGAAGNWSVPVVLGSGHVPTVAVGVMPALLGSVFTTALGGSVGVVGAGGSMGAVNLGGSVGIIGAGGSIGVTQIGAPWSLVGSVNAVNAGGSVGVIGAGGSVGVVGAGGSLGAVNLGGSVGVTPIGDFTVWLANAAAGSGFATVGVYGSVGVVGSVNVTPVASFTVNLASHIDAAGSAVRVNVVAGGAGGGVAQMQVTGTSGAYLGVGYASGAAQAVGNLALPILYASGSYATVNVGAMPALIGSVFAVNLGGSVGVIGAGGSLGAVNLGGSVGVLGIGGSFPVVGSVNVTPVASFTVNPGSVFTVNLGLGTVNLGNGVVGSVNVTPVASFTVNPGSVFTVNLGLGTVNVGNMPVVDTRIALTATQWAISFGGSGYSAISIASTSGNVRTKLYSIMLVSTGTVDVSFQSPSGTFLTGSIRIVPAAGFSKDGALGHPALIGGANATLFIHATGTQNVGGWVVGYIE